MDYVIEIDSFYESLINSIKGDGYQAVYPVTIHRYFECLEIKFFIQKAQAVKLEALYPVTVNILPRVEASSLEFQTSVNVQDGDERLEKALSQSITEFFTHACAGDSAAVNEFIKKLDPEKVKALFFSEESTLLLRING